jgi:hypothetical protein
MQWPLAVNLLTNSLAMGPPRLCLHIIGIVWPPQAQHIKRPLKRTDAATLESRQTLPKLSGRYNVDSIIVAKHFQHRL